MNEGPSTPRSPLSWFELINLLFWCLILWCLCCCRAMVITMVTSLLFILLLRYTADVLFWFLIFGVIAAIGYGESASCPPNPHNPLNVSANRRRDNVLSLRLSPRHLALLLGVPEPEWERGPKRHHLRHRLPRRLQHLPAAQSDVARFQCVGNFTPFSQLKALFIHAESFLSGCALQWSPSVWLKPSFWSSWFFWGQGCVLRLPCWKKAASKLITGRNQWITLDLKHIWPFLVLGPSATSCPLSSTQSSPLFFWPSASRIGL